MPPSFPRTSVSGRIDDTDVISRVLMGSAELSRNSHPLIDGMLSDSALHVQIVLGFPQRPNIKSGLSWFRNTRINIHSFNPGLLTETQEVVRTQLVDWS